MNTYQLVVWLVSGGAFGVLVLVFYFSQNTIRMNPVGLLMAVGGGFGLAFAVVDNIVKGPSPARLDVHCGDAADDGRDQVRCVVGTPLRLVYTPPGDLGPEDDLRVEFWHWDERDRLLGTDDDGSDGWSIEVDTTELTPETFHSFEARPSVTSFSDNGGFASRVVEAVGE